jgi:prevent-host-death family protein
MKQISIQDLKARLSSVIAEAEAGATSIVTRHGDPVAQLGPPRTAHVHGGTEQERKRLMPAARRGTKGRYLAVLLDDRGNR